MADNFHMNTGKDVFPNAAGSGSYSGSDGKKADRVGEENGEPFDFHEAMLQVEMIFQSSLLSYGFKEYSIENFVDKKYFYSWKGKEGCSDTDAMRQGLNIDGILEKENPSVNEVLTYLQYTLNIAELCRRNFNSDELTGYYFDLRSYTNLLTRIRELLTILKYDVKYVAEKEVIYLVTKDVAADAVTNTSSDPITDAIVEYNSYSVAGNLDRKRKILNDMGDMVESYTDNRSPGNVKLFSNIEFMLYNFNIRNNNFEGDDRVEHVASMSREELEAWYDETYQMMLLRILQHENLERMKRVDAVQQACEASSVESISKSMDLEGSNRVMSRRRVEDINFVAKNVAEAASVAQGNRNADRINSGKNKKSEEKTRKAEEKARDSMRAVREKEFSGYSGADLDKDVNAILAEKNGESEERDAEKTKPSKKKGYTPSFRDVSDTASTAVSHETDNSASFVKKDKDPEVDKWDEEYQARKKGWSDSETEDEWKISDTSGDQKQKKPRNPFKILLSVVIILLAALLAAAVSLIHFNYARSDYVSDKQIPVNTDAALIENYATPADIDDTVALALKTQVQHETEAAATTIDGSKMFNILVACSEDTGSNTYAPCDAVALISFNKATKRLTTVSLMNNLYADIEETGVVRLGDVPLYAGMPALVDIVRKTYGIPVNGYAWTDYRGMIKIIDRIGGIDAEVTEDEMKQANEYIDEMAAAYGEEEATHQLRMTGDVHLDGYQAVAYARISDSENEVDYAKTARQRKVLNSIAAAYEAAGFGEKTSIMREILPYVTHNITESQVFGNLFVFTGSPKYAKAGFSLPLEGHHEMQGTLTVPDFAETLPVVKQILSDTNADRALGLLTESGVATGTESSSVVVISGPDVSETVASDTSSSDTAVPSEESTATTDSDVSTATESNDSGSETGTSSGAGTQDRTGEPRITPEAPWSWTT
ncbi:MAG: LCP family protein [Lachnospiraceae bacterium]|nr:LCP family protein [Lachnospiraceae bacterium]